ncbi:MAG: SoxR reducing system RseC family protein [Bacteroidales bacterium]|nr:SoxR reducing system RseC family protein [Bacteroidales bacterium]
MERLDRIASHDGVVTAVKPDRVTVTIEAVSACATCAAHGRCGFADSKEKSVDVPLAADSKETKFEVGDAVTVHIDESRGMLAVWLAYVLPALLILAAVAGLSLAHLPEWAVVAGAFAALGLYILILYLRRRHVESHFTLTPKQ